MMTRGLSRLEARDARICVEYDHDSIFKPEVIVCVGGDTEWFDEDHRDEALWYLKGAVAAFEEVTR
jgi:hypothetical protein